MKKVITIIAILLITSLFVHSQKPVQDDIDEGSKPYTPTRLEYLVLKANQFRSESPAFLNDAKQFLFLYVTEDKKNTIRINVIPGLARQIDVNASVKSLKKSIMDEAKSKNWDKWLKIEVVDMLSLLEDILEE